MTASVKWHVTSRCARKLYLPEAPTPRTRDSQTSRRRPHSRLFLSLLIKTVGVASLWAGDLPPGGVEPAVVYHRFDFNTGSGDFKSTRGASLVQEEQGTEGLALSFKARSGGGGVKLPIDISESRELKIAFLARGTSYERVWMNVYDRVSDDNTTSRSPRVLPPGRWAPVIYYLDTFRYNSKKRTTVSLDTDYSTVRLFHPQPADNSQLWIDSFVVYRGRDDLPPDKVENLSAKLSGGKIALTWDSAADDVGAMTYVVSRRDPQAEKFSKVAETAHNRWTDSEALSGTTQYRVLAVDFERNLGTWSDSLGVQLGGVEAESRPKVAVRAAHRADLSALRQGHRKGAGRVEKGLVFLFGDSLSDASVYPREVQAQLGIFRVEAKGSRRKRTNFAREKVAEILAEENPEYLLVLFGTNNLRTGGIPSNQILQGWMSDLQSVVEAAFEWGTIPVLGTVPPRGFDDPESAPEAAYNRAIEELGSRLGVAVAPIFKGFQAAPDRTQLLSGDGIHWRPAGMTIAARAWAQALEEVEWVLRDRP